MPSLFSRFKRKSGSHKSTEPSSPTTSQPSAPASPSAAQHGRTSDIGQAPRGPSLDVEDIPPRSTSLHESAAKAPSHRSEPKPVADVDTLPNIGGLALSARTDDAPQLPPLSFDTNRPDAANETLEHQRASLVEGIASEARSRKGEGLSDAGRVAFAAAGFGEQANNTGSLEVETRYLKPVVQETIILKEHVETTTVIDRHIHQHHVYPKIQPISDPNPIRLEPHHRIFSALDGKWHEVIGDAAAIAILGEDVFYNGKKEVREERKMAMPGLGGEVDERAFEARVVEREGVKGEGMGSWHQLKGLAGLDETPDKMKGEGWMLPEEEMGPVQRTVGIAL